ncbi:ribosome biogenesis/translation initiation ATPase RLI [Methanocella sp. CWC-04]|uniref:Ribosome biogenesis/translation initiation ATPase RLI n=1 Tax=Methanooceanicella nereidis TaxID=2052831 RepID=A0AAP2RCZ9_9EURY|nr:ribosome biogenesis/translation initiation ATPase RLI [Methanocella sp. CWC-04]MCD1294621.1 ribosome biogenesis/translation initiation ATPase RLI [Methanocella sp. CWC-04]
MRIAILDKERCKPRNCGTECIKYCPKVRSGDETVVMGEDGKPVISEELCVGCGICIKKCPAKAIMIIGLPDKLEGQLTHRYGDNGFALYGLPIPSTGRVSGILGPNGVGKSTAVKILSGQMMPNLGSKTTTWDDVYKFFSGSELQDYLKRVSGKSIKTSQKPQYVDLIPKAFKGKVSQLLKRADERGMLDSMAADLDLTNILDREISDLSGGELQRVAIAACIMRDAGFYFFDEVTPYLDIFQRIKVAKIIKKMGEEKNVMVVEHDLAILDLLADMVHVAYGEPGGYGVITHPKGVRVGINEYLKGYLPEENIRIRPQPIEFDVKAPKEQKDVEKLIDFGSFSKTFEKFRLDVKGGQLRKREVVGIVGPNGIGKSTFAKLLAGVMDPDAGKLDFKVKISYKPQYIKTDIDMSVRMFLRSISPKFDTSYVRTEILLPLQIERLMDCNVNDLSGGELQRVAIAACIGREADIYILDEPSAHLDVEQRTLATKVIKRFAENNDVTVMVIDHDIYMIDLLADRLLVFDGEPGVSGEVHGPFEMREGMNRFLSSLDITFRRDEETRRPRVNKPESNLDREQKKIGEYYYLPQTE